MYGQLRLTFLWSLRFLLWLLSFCPSVPCKNGVNSGHSAGTFRMSSTPAIGMPASCSFKGISTKWIPSRCRDFLISFFFRLTNGNEKRQFANAFVANSYGLNVQRSTFNVLLLLLFLLLLLLLLLNGF